MPYNFATHSFRAKKLCSILSLRQIHFYKKNSHFAVFSPHLGSLEAMYAVHFRLTGELLVDLPIMVITELFSLGAVVLSQCTRLTDRQTDGQLLIARQRCMQLRDGNKTVTQSSKMRIKLKYITFIVLLVYRATQNQLQFY